MNRQSGLTLIEMIITVAIIGILAAVAYPTFDRYQLKVSRADGIAGLEIAANAMELCGARTFNYAHANCALSAAMQTSPRGRYTIAISQATASTFSLTATKNVNNDTECGVLSLNHFGQRGMTGTKSVKFCWSK